MRKVLAFEQLLPHTGPDAVRNTASEMPALDDVLCGLALIGMLLAGVLA